MKRHSAVSANAKAIVDAMIDRDLSVGEAAKAAGIHVDTMTRLIRSNQPIHYKTAAKLKATFGADAVIVEPAAQM